MPKILLPDINIWLALAFEGHVHHVIAAKWFESLSDETCCFCRLTQQGFLRLSSNPGVFKQNAQTMSQAWQNSDLLMSDPRVSWAEEPAGTESTWRSFSQREAFSPHVWNDAYLAAFALEGSMELVTLDHGLTQYRGVQCSILV